MSCVGSDRVAELGSFSHGSQAAFGMRSKFENGFARHGWEMLPAISPAAKRRIQTDFDL